jgi:hypothetical protein
VLLVLIMIPNLKCPWVFFFFCSLSRRLVGMGTVTC